MTTTLAFLDGVLGTAWWTVLVFIAGALVGTPLWNWIKTYLPWNKQ
tara:strand:- start:2027 stop:2164 length:138 start_codon:yes stop_codon:yes gene_type:complete